MALLCAPVTTIAQQKDIVDTAAAAGTFKSLAAARQAAGLVQTLKGPGPFTAFALLKDKPELAKVLTYHVFAGNANSSDLKQLKDLSMANGGRLKISTSGAALVVDTAKVVKADVPASNGVIHIIDTVLMPK